MQKGSHQAPSELKLKRRKREVLDVHGGRIVRPRGRKDRHSKVSTTSGTRDRRVRLSPNTAIQFYDLQDRLGCDRPSKALDWLMKEAKDAIDALDQPDNNLNGTVNTVLSEEGFQEQCIPEASQSLADDSVVMPFYQQGLFSVSSPSYLEEDLEMDGFPRLFTWNWTRVVDSSTFATPPMDQNEFFSQREPLQSSICAPAHAVSTAQLSSIGLSRDEVSRLTDEPNEEKGKGRNSIPTNPSSGASSRINYKNRRKY